MSVLAIAQIPQRWSTISSAWASSKHFALAGGFVILIAMVLVGTFASYILSRATIQQTAAATALFVDSFLTPLVQELASGDVLKPKHIAALERLFGDDEFERRFPHLEIWKEGGVVAYSTNHQLIGQTFTSPRGLISGLRGEFVARYTDQHPWEQKVVGIGQRHLEIYVPIREIASGRVIAVAELHEDPAHLQQDLLRVSLQSWSAVAAATIVVMSALLVVVYYGNKIIIAQQTELQQRIVQIERTSRQNQKLREQVQRASSCVTEVTEAYRRSVGADLHDGPAQLIGFAALKVEHVRRANTVSEREKELKILDTVLASALRDVREISRGLMLPEIEHLPLQDIVARAVRDHEQRTGSEVSIHCECAASFPFSHAVKICVYRFLQEGLNNAFRHAGGNGQKVCCKFDGMTLTVAVEDRGRTSPADNATPNSGLGLIGLRERVESLGGNFCIQREPEGTRIEMSLVMGRISRDG